MPWCAECAKYLTPSAMDDDGTCPVCGHTVELAVERRPAATAKNLDIRRLAAGEDADEAELRTPWHFKLLMVLLALYLGWRVVQLFT